jgi:tRNA-specific 2-thiouridylase
LSDKIELKAGSIVDSSGAELSKHDGALGYTVGQRKGLKIGRPAKDGKPRYVLEIRPKENVVVVGTEDALTISEISGQKFSWCGKAPDNSSDWFEAEVQVRAHGQSHPCKLRIVDGQMVIRPNVPIRGISPGQTAVVYLGSRVLGQTTIDKTVSAVLEQV